MYQRLLRQLHEAGAALADAELREKAARLEAVSARIFALAEADPEKEEQLRKFTGYYLPTALKLLHTYAQLDGQGVDGENITRTKQSIERSLDLLITAFENQLDKLFQSDALDVSADIAALEDVVRPCAPGSSFTVGGLDVETFPISHDAAEPMGFAVSDGERKSLINGAEYPASAIGLSRFYDEGRAWGIVQAIKGGAGCPCHLFANALSPGAFYG